MNNDITTTKVRFYPSEIYLMVNRHDSSTVFWYGLDDWHEGATMTRAEGDERLAYWLAEGGEIID